MTHMVFLSGHSFQQNMHSSMNAINLYAGSPPLWSELKNLRTMIMYSNHFIGELHFLHCANETS